MIHARASAALRTLPRVRASIGPAPEGIDWEAAGWAGLAGGGVLILLETVLASLFTGGPDTDPVRQIAAIALNQAASPASTPFTILVFLAAMAVHLPLSLLYARILAAVIHPLGPEKALAAGAAFGAALYAVNYYGFTVVFPWFEASRGWITLTAHLAFGLAAAGAYVLLRRGGGARPRLGGAP